MQPSIELFTITTVHLYSQCTIVYVIVIGEFNNNNKLMTSVLSLVVIPTAVTVLVE